MNEWLNEWRSETQKTIKNKKKNHVETDQKSGYSVQQQKKNYVTEDVCMYVFVCHPIVWTITDCYCIAMARNIQSLGCLSASNNDGCGD